MTRFCARPFFVLLLSVLATACSEHGVITAGPGDDGDGLVADGAGEVDDLLAGVHEAQAPFDRVGVLWEGTGEVALEVATSDDGESWSPWVELEVVNAEAGEDGASYVGRHDVVGAPARFYKLRAPAVTVRFVSVEAFDFASASDATASDASAEAAETSRRALVVGNATVADRASWGARRPRCSSSHRPNRITIHHTVTPTNDSLSPQARLRQIQSFHQDVRGWCDIGYHFLVSRDGRLWQGRPADNLGTHVAGANTGNVGISFMGTHDVVAPTDAQRNAAASLVAGLATTYGIAIDSQRVRGHRDQNNTSCPGDALYADLPDIRARAAAGGGAPSPFEAMDVSWRRVGPSTYAFRTDAPDDVARVEYFVDGYPVGGAERAAEFAATYAFTVARNERVLEVRGFDDGGEQVAEAAGLLDVTDGFGFFIRQAGAGVYEIGLENAPAGVAAVEVSVDGSTLADGVTGQRRSARKAVRSELSRTGTRQFALSTFNADGSLRGTLYRTFTLR